MTKKREGVDMSREAITARLEDVRQLYRLGIYLVEVGRVAGLNDGIGKPKRTTP